jgi:glycosyltransferase involved in cell wall biosynthesis
VGYYGAIADWFDANLVAELARMRPEWQIQLIGSTLGGNIRPFADAANVHLLGERPYRDLPRLIAGWDVFIIPFKRVPLTEATNPVKVYEMLATGKPVVAVALPELVPIAREGLIRLGGTAEEFTWAIEAELSDQDRTLADRRRAFAQRNTWRSRHVELATAIDEILRQRRRDRLARDESCAAVCSLAV